MRTPLQSRSATSADRMLDATLDLLAEGGLGAVTVAAVARAAGTSNGSLYHRFGDRAGLLLAAQDRALGAIETQTLAAFARADAEPATDAGDEAAVLLLAHAAVGLYDEHRAAMRAFLVEGREVREGGDLVGLQERNDAWARVLATTITGWLVRRLGAAPPQAEAAYRIIHALGVTQALLDEPRISPTPLDPEVLARSLARAVLAIVRD